MKTRFLLSPPQKMAGTIAGTRVEIQKSVCDQINKVVSKPFHLNQEVEVRFSYRESQEKEKKKRVSGLGKEKGRELWYTLMKYLEDSDEYEGAKKEKTLVEFYNDIRVIADLGTPSPISVQKKRTIDEIEILNFLVDQTQHEVRLVQSSEVPLPDFKASGKSDKSRVRTRISYLAKDKSHRFDLSYVIPNSYEVEIEYLKMLELVAFMKPVKLVVNLIKGERKIISTRDEKMVKEKFNQFFGREVKEDQLYTKGIPQPVNLKRSQAGKLNAYSVTNKLNGTRYMGLILNQSFYLLNMAGNVIKILDGLSADLNGTLMDTEYFKEKVYAFDLLFVAHKDVRNKNLDQRLDQLRIVVSNMRALQVTVKTFYMSENLAEDASRVLRESKPEDNDGLIFTPITDPYFNNNIYKWKPPHELTIDFLPASIGPNKYTLQVSGPGDKLIPFTPSGFNGIITSEKELKGVGEYKWEGKTFVLVRPRPDKKTPNFITVATNVWEDILDPLLEKDLLELLSSSQEDRDTVRKYHNSVKRELISQNLQKSRLVLDLGAGKGGDLAKYQAAEIRSLYAIEPNEVNLAELKVRAREMESRKKLTFSLETLQARAQETEKITALMGNRKATAASLFFCLNFFFENQWNLQSLINTLVQNIEKDGLVIGTTIDGASVAKLMRDRQIVEVGPAVIRKAYTDFDGEIGYGRKIYYQYKGSNTVDKEQLEYLVDWDLFVRMMETAGFALVRSDSLNQNKWMSIDDSLYNSLYRTFVFQRTERKFGAQMQAALSEEDALEIDFGAEVDAAVSALPKSVKKTRKIPVGKIRTLPTKDVTKEEIEAFVAEIHERK
jgi:hypothetical protein